MSTIRSVKSSSGGAGVLAIETRILPSTVSLFQSCTGSSHSGDDTLRADTGPGLEERLEFAQERIAGAYLSGIQNSVAETVLT